MRELDEVRDETVKLSGDQCFLINRVTIEINGERLFWWKIYYWGGRMSGGKQFTAHAPTKEDAMFQLESIRKTKFARLFWNDEDFNASKQRKKKVRYRFKELLNELLTLLPELKIE